MKVLLIIGVAIMLSACNVGNDKVPYPIDDFSQVIPTDTGTMYFPLDSLYFISNQNIQSDSFIKRMYSEILFHLKEPVLYKTKCNNETLRLLWVRAFDNPVIIRASKWQDSITVNVKELGKQFFNNDSFIYKRKLDTSFTYKSTTQWNTILKLNSYDSLNVENYKDATMWILEYNFLGKYHCINRLYLNSNSLDKYPIAKEMYEVGNIALSLKSRWEP